jgi:hypothetical protein
VCEEINGHVHVHETTVLFTFFCEIRERVLEKS